MIPHAIENSILNGSKAMWLTRGGVCVTLKFMTLILSYIQLNTKWFKSNVADEGLRLYNIKIYDFHSKLHYQQVRLGNCFSCSYTYFNFCKDTQVIASKVFIIRWISVYILEFWGG